MYTNSQSLPGKVQELEALANDLKPDMILLCETWCNANISNATLNIEGYELQQSLRKDRSDTVNGIGGGLVVYTRDGLRILPCDEENSFNQYCKLCLTSGGEKYYIYLVYRPPSSGQENKELLSELVREASRNSLMIGDFNLPGIDWDDGVAEARDQPFVKAMQDSFFRQLVDFPTHTKGNILDLVITNIPEKVGEIKEVGRIGKSDHVILQFDLEVSAGKEEVKQAIKNWKRADWREIREGLAVTTWPTTNDRTTAEEAWKLLRDKLEQLVDQHVPSSTFRPRKSEWMTGDILRELRRKRRLWKRAKYGHDKEEYQAAEKKVKNLIRNAKRNLEKRLASEKNKNSKPFYNYVKKKTSVKVAIGPLITSTGAAVSNEAQMAEELNNHFSSVFTREDKSTIPEPSNMRTRSKLTGTWITTEKVRRKIKKLKPHSAAGPDGITPKLLQNCIEEISPVLAMIYRKSMVQGVVPEEWRQANVIPIFKKGKKSDPGNYRPVSLTSVACKMMESIVKDDLMAHLERNRLINKSQHGFMRNRSCTTNLLEFLEVITEAADSGKNIDVIYLDFAKAFDKVPTERLLRKLRAHGVEGRMASWIRAWLTDRKQRVSVRGKFSSWKQVLSGVPQGSVLGPVLFLLFINDLDQVTTRNQTVKKFADDTKVAQVIETAEDAAELQETLDRLVKWADTWGMAFNVAKCHVMHIGPKNLRHSYRMAGAVLGISESERDIGVTVDHNLKPSVQCKKATQTASVVLGQIIRSFHYRDRHIFVRLYLQYVRPHLEFSVAAWAPWTQADITCLERIQQRAVKAISGLKGTTYEERLLELGLPSLQDRRREIDMVQTYKIVNKIDSDEPGQWFTRADSRRPTRQGDGKDRLLPVRSQHEYRKNFFSVRVIDEWNKLPDTTKEAANVGQFKRLYRRHRGMVAHAVGEQ